jgi:hypothetical protein
VSFCSASSARCSSSAPASPGVAQLAQVVHRVAADVAQRDLALLGEAAHDLDEVLAALLGQLGIVRRIIWPSLDGVRPTSDSMIARSIALIEFLS